MALSKDFEQRYKNAIQKSLKDTVIALNRLACAILENEKMCIPVAIAEVRILIKDAEAKASQAKERSREFLTEIQHTIGQLILRQKQTSDELKELQSKLKNLNMSLKPSNENKKRTEDSLQSAERHLKKAEQTLAFAKSSYDRNEIVRDVGIGMTILLAVPLFGLIPGITGAIMWGAGQIALDDAIIELHEAQQTVNACRDKIRWYRDESSRFKKEIEETNNHISRLERLQQFSKQDLNNMKENLRILADIQEKFQHCTHFLNVLVGRVEILNFTSKNIICWEVVIQNMEEIAKHLFQVHGDTACKRYQLLYQPEIMNMIQENKSTSSRVKAILKKNKYAIHDFI
ncbi:uncharacterized protein LOC122815990 [Protopterus annectens]|uniref:uncharacterized protein LOC122815990 n=1 Tax=Protopterus annectens TaxID=7888 RepID=UPI001CF9EF22|nr:uncharacterized protein LOC122815990 [Protopterus annectens]